MCCNMISRALCHALMYHVATQKVVADLVYVNDTMHVIDMYGLKMLVLKILLLCSYRYKVICMQ